VDYRILLYLTRAGHQLSEQRLLLLAKRWFLFHLRISSFISFSVPDSLPAVQQNAFLGRDAKRQC
jgi:hypothetical protein